MKRILYFGYRQYGNSIDFLDGSRTNIAGWYPIRFDNGSFIIDNPSDETKQPELFLISDLKFCNNPRDMFFAKVTSFGYISRELADGPSEPRIEYVNNIIKNNKKPFLKRIRNIFLKYKS